MQCTLLIPSLFLPQEFADAAYREMRVGALHALLARSRLQRFPAVTTEEWLCNAFEVERQHDWPVAPLTLALDGGEPGLTQWLRADPVHLRVARDRLMLVDSSQLDVTLDQAVRLTEALSNHFGTEGLRFNAPTPQRWYLSAAHPPGLVTRTLSEVAGKDVRPFAPAGSDALQWRRILNELQMLLHDHPVNEERERLGLPAINSVWLWGAGTRPAVPGRHFSGVSGDDALAHALATAAGTECRDLPPNAEAWLRNVSGKGTAAHELIVCNDALRASRYADLAAWQSAIENIDRCWLSPLLKATKSRDLGILALVVPTEQACWRFELRPSDLFKFWRTGQRPSDFE